MLNAIHSIGLACVRSLHMKKLKSKMENIYPFCLFLPFRLKWIFLVMNWTLLFSLKRIHLRFPRMARPLQRFYNAHAHRHHCIWWTEMWLVLSTFGHMLNVLPNGFHWRVLFPQTDSGWMCAHVFVSHRPYHYLWFEYLLVMAMLKLMYLCIVGFTCHTRTSIQTCHNTTTEFTWWN